MTVLRPMSTGEILDRTFSMYRGHFWLFAGIAAVPPAMMLVVQLFWTVFTFANGSFRPGQPVTFSSHFTVATLLVGGLGVLLAAIAYLVGYAVAQGATVFAVSAVHLGRESSIRESYRRMRGRWGRVCVVELLIFIRVVGIALLLMLVVGLLIGLAGGGIAASGSRSGANPLLAVIIALVMIFGLLAALVVTFVFYARYSLAVPSCVLEDLQAQASIKRSVLLANGNYGKILAVMVLTFVLAMGVNLALQLPIQLLALAMLAQGRLSAQLYLTILNHLVTFVSGAVVGPVGTIALSLVYYDARVRKEAFDIQFLMESITSPPPVTAIPPSSAPEVSSL
jgi:hypothetical protein